MLVLLVEDDPEDEFILCEAVASVKDSVTIHTVKNGTEALAFLEALPGNQLPLLIITDLNMPKMNGTELLQELKETDAFKNIPVVIYSTSANEPDQARCIQMGAHAYIIKPLTYKQSLEIAQKIIGITETLQIGKNII